MNHGRSSLFFRSAGRCLGARPVFPENILNLCGSAAGAPSCQPPLYQIVPAAATVLFPRPVCISPPGMV
ncbi:hypothetical protein BACCAP_02691 [Pseudoflavonifractor capillosus ATCC 29799]|uniref:Uncharacterized protein n=1 Tax=Pseudoflavonifractor capillosus ATCC 29799 TaxID=411467 RepID=A6NWU5_9FIRM|nr:hypothetical protein BACCAP_02691 [Pseudoflavonifractor capillosus ATCC 29799]